MLAEFLTDLFEHGRVTVSAPEEEAATDISAAQRVLQESARNWKQGLPPGLPEFDPDIALWGAGRLYTAAACLVYRHIGPEEIRRLLSRRDPAPRTPSEHFSVDLCLQFMKDVLRLAQAASENDPLCNQIVTLLQDWPLSAVGTPSEAEPPDVVLNHPALKLMYLERVVSRKDTRAMKFDTVCSALRGYAGAHQEVLPEAIVYVDGSAPLEHQAGSPDEPQHQG